VTDDTLALPGPAWKLKEIMVSGGSPFLVFKYATFRTNEELLIYQHSDGSYDAYLTGTEGKQVTSRLSQERWAEIYCKAIAGQALLGRKPEIIEEIFSA
jgi:hypothetical protein